jgi:phosphoribosylformylglycinamidine synthase
MVGGRIGRDGIHGATFSSLAMDTSSASMSNSSVVQLGDPFTQKRALDFLMIARDRGLYRTLTDNGAGGLSSSVGELATLSNGADLDLTEAPLKALDLRPEEILVSESQERMSVAVPKENLDEFLALSKAMRVESTALGTFTRTGRFVVRHRGSVVADLGLEFLHDGCPDLDIQAEWSSPPISAFTSPRRIPSLRDALPSLLASDNIRSKETLLSQYDHEVQGCSLVKPQTQVGERRSPNQAAAVRLTPESPVAATVGVGILPEYSRYDAYTMAQASLDEAVRNVLATGSEYGENASVLALLDNFCWPDPVSNARYAADLVRAAYGLRDAAMALGLPFVSGKDSMKNDFRGKTRSGEPVKISVLPTVLVTALGRIPEPSRARTSEFKVPGDAVYFLGHREL